MAVHIYQNRNDEYIFDDNGSKETTRVLLRRATSKSSFGVCVTSSPVQIWLSYPRQVFGFENENGKENIHICGFDNGPFAWDDYKRDYYELYVLDIELMNKIRSLLSEIDIDLILSLIELINGMLQNINWLANKNFSSLPLNECLTINEEICLYLKKFADVLSKYFFGVKEIVFD